MIRGISDAVVEDDEESVVTAIADLRAALDTGDNGSFTEASVALSRSCESNGWESPEG